MSALKQPKKPNLDQMQVHSRTARRAAHDAREAVEKAGRKGEEIQRELAESDKAVEPHLKVLRRARLL